MIGSLKKLMGVASSTEVRSGDVATALEIARQEIASAEREYAAAEEAYGSGLLRLDDNELKALIEGRQTAAIRRDRVVLLISTLEQKLAATREAEAVAALTAERRAVEVEAETVASLVRTEYPRLATALVTMLRRLEVADEAAHAVNQKLIEAGRRHELVRDVQARALPDAGRHSREHSIWGGTQLADIPGFAPGWHAPPETGGWVIQNLPYGYTPETAA